MRLPEVKTRNKIRDFEICRRYATEHKTMEEIGVSFNVTRTRISQILYKNRHLLKLEIDWEKLKRINWLKRQLDKCTDSKKDPADLLEQLRKEIEGDKPTVDLSTKYHIQILNYGKDKSPDTSRGVQRATPQVAT